MDPRDDVSLGTFGLITEFRGSVTQHLPARPDAVFDRVTDVVRLPEWNAAIEAVVEAPAELRRGAEWVVVMRPRGWPRWDSRSTVEELDRDRLRFVHTTRTDDGNPSRGEWTWQVRPVPGGAALSVSWSMCPRTLGRRSVIGRLRRVGLQREVRASLTSLGTHLRSASAAAPSDDPTRGHP